MFNFDLAKNQLEDLIEFFWAAVEFDDQNQDKKSYETARKEVEYLAAARKNTRQFAQTDLSDLSDEEKHLPKSSLDGKRESVIPEKLYPKDHYKNKDEMAKKLYDNFKVRDKERLCGVGLLKRLGSESEMNKVASTPHIAALPFLKSLENKKDRAKIVTAVDNYTRKLTEIADVIEFHKTFGKLNGKPHSIFKNFDAKILFESRLKDHFANEADLNEAKEALKNFFTETETKQSEPSPYYAVLLADGDNMGKAIDAQLQKNDPIERHRNISRALSEFAQEVTKIVSKHEGSLVYAGGDDVLALVPIHTVLCCAKELNKTFFNKLENFKDENGKSPTLSVGIAVAHYLEPLSDALELVRKAEKAAKGVEGKNALAVIVDKRSGTSRTINGNFAKTYKLLRSLINLDNEKDVSHQLAYELRDLSKRLEVDERHLTDDEKNNLEKIKKAETERIINRKLNQMKKKNISEEDRKLKFGVIYDSATEKEGAGKLADELITAKIFADAEKTAGMNDKPEEKENV